jgi:large subunit ribosomal protein L31
MKKQGHPAYQKVLFVDSSTGFKFVCGTTLKTKDTEMFEGVEYPVARVSTSSASHPFWTKSNQFIDSEGRIDKFKKKYKKEAAPAVEAAVEEDTKKKKKK